MKNKSQNKYGITKEDAHDPNCAKPKPLSQIFKEMPYTDKRGKGFVQCIHKLPEQTKTNQLQDDKIEDENKGVTERKSFLHLRSLKIRPE